MNEIHSCLVLLPMSQIVKQEILWGAAAKYSSAYERVSYMPPRTHPADEWQVQDLSKDWHTTKEVHCHWEEAAVGGKSEERYKGNTLWAVISIADKEQEVTFFFPWHWKDIININIFHENLVSQGREYTLHSKPSIFASWRCALKLNKKNTLVLKKKMLLLLVTDITDKIFIPSHCVRSINLK